MKNIYPTIKFIYSLPYDRLLTEYENKDFDPRQIKEIRKYIKKLQPRWNRISNSVFQILQEIVKNKWQEKKIKCYVVKYYKYSGISHPLTIRTDSDSDYVLAVLTHELAHILTRYDFEKYKKIEQKIKKRFPNENQRTILHIYINFIELQVLRKLFTQKFVNKIIKRNLTFRGIRKAWKIILGEEENLKKLFETPNKI